MILMYNSLNNDINDIFAGIAEQVAANDVVFVMPAFYPQRGGILEEIAEVGGKVIIAGGAPNQKLFAHITQYSPGYDTTGIAETPKEIHEIVKAIPSELVKGKKIALFVEAPVGKYWSNNLKLKGADIVASNEQNLRAFFEEKTNLEMILKTAGLQDCFIPSEVVETVDIDEAAIKNLYEKYKGEDGKVVLQSCGQANCESGGGKGTSIVSSYEEFASDIMQHNGSVKIAKFVTGYCSNMSMFVGNVIADKNGRGMKKLGLSSSDNPFNPGTLHDMLARGRAAGIDDDKLVVIPARASLKAIGDKNLTRSSSNGVGNSLGYEFPEAINAKVYEIATKLGKLMGKCGKVGLCGADLIIDKNNHIWINEVNDRQQGPTEQLSLDAEECGLPGIHRLAFIANYADCNNPKVQRLFYRLQQTSRDVYEQSLQTNGSFYIKFMGKQSGTAISHIDLSSGIYALDRKGKGWQWNFNETYSSQPNIDLNNDRIYVKLTGASLQKGQKVPQGAQILRVVGKAKNGSSPFKVENGRVVLNPKWLPIINGLYGSMFGNGYNRTIEMNKGRLNGRI